MMVWAACSRNMTVTMTVTGALLTIEERRMVGRHAA